MSYTPRQWENNVTPLNQDNMNTIENGLANAARVADQAYPTPTNGIPKADLSNEVQTLLNKVSAAAGDTLVGNTQLSSAVAQINTKFTDYTTTVELENYLTSKQDKFLRASNVDANLSDTSLMPVQNKTLKAAVDSKADQATTYNKTQVDALLATKQDTLAPILSGTLTDTPSTTSTADITSIATKESEDSISVTYVFTTAPVNTSAYQILTNQYWDYNADKLLTSHTVAVGDKITVLKASAASTYRIYGSSGSALKTISTATGLRQALTGSGDIDARNIFVAIGPNSGYSTLSTYEEISAAYTAGKYILALCNGMYLMLNRKALIPVIIGEGESEVVQEKSAFCFSGFGDDADETTGFTIDEATNTWSLNTGIKIENVESKITKFVTDTTSTDFNLDDVHYPSAKLVYDSLQALDDDRLRTEDELYEFEALESASQSDLPNVYKKVGDQYVQVTTIEQGVQYYKKVMKAKGSINWNSGVLQISSADQGGENTYGLNVSSAGVVTKYNGEDIFNINKNNLQINQTLTVNNTMNLSGKWQTALAEDGSFTISWIGDQA